MLAPLDPRLLDRIEFPLGEQDEGADAGRGGERRPRRRRARARARRRASSPATTTARSWAGRASSAADGTVVDEDGNELGRHDGYWRYTPGQRRGLGIAAPQPLYALRTDAATNTVVVGPRAALACSDVLVEGRLHVPVVRAEAKLRYRSSAVSARVSPREGGFRLELDEPAFAVAPGQVVALYDDGAVVGSGVVSAASRD